MKISYKVPLIATAVILAAFAAFGTYQYKMIEKNIYQQTESNIQEVSGALNAEITTWLNERLKIIAGMSDLIASSNTTKDELLRVMRAEAFESSATYFYSVLERDGKMISNANIGVPDDWDGRTRPWYQLALKYDQPMMTAPYEDSVDQRLLITAVNKLYEGRRPVGVIGADIELKAVSDAVNAVNFNGAGYAFIVDSQGNIITYPDQSLYGKNISALYSGLKPSLTSRLQESTINGKAVFTNFFPLDKYKGSENKWFIGIAVDKKKVLAPAYDLGRNAIIAALLTVLLSSILFYLFMWNALIKPVNQLAEQSNDISRGKLTEQIQGVDRNDEIGDLAQAIQRMQKALHMAMTKLAANRKK